MHSDNSIDWIESRLKQSLHAIFSPFITKIGHKHDFSSMISLSEVSAIFNFEITWASNPISLAN